MKRLEFFLLALAAPLDYALLIAAAASAYALRFTPWATALRPVMFDLSFWGYLRLAAVVAAGWLLLFAVSGLYAYDPGRRLMSDICKIFLSCSAGLAGIALVIMFTQQLFDSRFLAAVGWAFAVAYVSIGRVLLSGAKALIHRWGYGNRRVVLVGDAPAAQTLASAFEKQKTLGMMIVGRYPTFAAARIALREGTVDELIYVSPTPGGGDALAALLWCVEHQVVFQYSADLFAAFATNVAVRPIAGIPIVEVRRTRLEGWGRIVKRLCDMFGSAIALVVASPIMMVAACAVFLDTGRPVLYKNERVGFQGKKFFALKFRSMHQKDCTGPQFGAFGAEAEKREAELIRAQSIKSGPVYKIANDPRVTPVGRLLRLWSIDELPQFFNVLFGDMSMVGPRPHQPREVARYKAEHKRVLEVKPGITGLAQISGRSDLSFEEEMRLDAFYLERWSIPLDCIICLKTPFVLFRERKAL